jgi:hypothetical protein
MTDTTDEFEATPQQVADWLAPNRDFDLSVIIDREEKLDGVAISFMPHGHGDGSAVLNIIWDADSRFDNGKTETEGQDGLKWIEVGTGGLYETTGLVRGLVELGDRLRPLLFKLYSEAAAGGGA